MINHCARLKVYLLCLIVQRCIVHLLMLLNVNTHANGVKFVRVNEVHGSANECIFAV